MRDYPEKLSIRVNILQRVIQSIAVPVEVLREVRQLYPETLRLSGQAHCRARENSQPIGSPLSVPPKGEDHCLFSKIVFFNSKIIIFSVHQVISSLLLVNHLILRQLLLKARIANPHLRRLDNGFWFVVF